MLTDYLQEAYASAPSGIVELRTLTLSHPDPQFGGPVYLVADFRDFKAKLETGIEVTFQACPFRTSSPRLDESGRIERRLEIDNVSADLSKALNRISDMKDPVSVIYRVYLSNDPSGPQKLPVEKTVLTQVVVTAAVISGTATTPDLINRKFPTDLYTAKRFPGLIR